MDFYEIIKPFDQERECGEDGLAGPVITEFCVELAKEKNETVKKFLDLGLGKTPSKFAPFFEEFFPYDILNPIITISFAVGYVFGANLEIAEEDALKAIEELKKRLIEKGALLYFPRDWMKKEPQPAAKQN